MYLVPFVGGFDGRVLAFLCDKAKEKDLDWSRLVETGEGFIPLSHPEPNPDQPPCLLLLLERKSTVGFMACSPVLVLERGRGCDERRSERIS